MMSDATEKSAIETAKQHQAEIVYDSPPSEIDDEVWLTHGAKMLEDSVPGVRNAASELIKALGMLQTVYLGILGFANLPKDMKVYNKALFIVPLIPWVIAVYYCLRVMKTEIVEINLRSPDAIRAMATESLKEKQQHLEIAFALLIAGIVTAFVMVVFRLHV